MDDSGPDHRRRLKHYDLPGHAHYLTFSCFRRQPFLGRSSSQQWFLETLAEARRKLRFDLWAYVIMPEHVAHSHFKCKGFG